MKFLGLALSLVISFASSANASILVEPYLGYGMGTYEEGAKGKMNSTVIGGRIAGEVTTFFIGGDYSMSVGGKGNDDSSGDFDFDSTQLYGVIGVNLPIIRAWAGYGLMNELMDTTFPGDLKYKGGTHIKLGVGFKVIPMLSLNVEYLISDYKEVETALGTVNSDLKSNTVLLSASVPFSF